MDGLRCSGFMGVGVRVCGVPGCTKSVCRLCGEYVSCLGRVCCVFY